MQPSRIRRLLASVVSFLGPHRTFSEQSPGSSANLGETSARPTTLQQAMRAASSGEPSGASEGRLLVQDGAGSNPEVAPGDRRTFTMPYGQGRRMTADEGYRALGLADGVSHANHAARTVFGKRRAEDPATAGRAHLAETYAEPGETNGLDRVEATIEAERAAARSLARSLARLGWKWRGGVEWAPPLGKAPNFDLMERRDIEAELLRTRVEVLDAKRQDLEARLRIAEARADVREASALETARLIAEAAGWRRQAEIERAFAAHALDFISYVQEGRLTKDFPEGTLEQVCEAWLFSEEGVLEAVRTWKANRDAFAKWQKDRSAKNDGGGATRAQPELPGAAVVGRDGVSGVQPAMGRERPGAAGVPPIGRPADQAQRDRVAPEPRTADTAAIVDVLLAERATRCREASCQDYGRCTYPNLCRAAR